MKVQWVVGGSWEEINWSPGIGWCCKVNTDDSVEFIDWCCEMMRGFWQVRCQNLPGSPLCRVELDIEDSQDFMILKLAWGGSSEL